MVKKSKSNSSQHNHYVAIVAVVAVIAVVILVMNSMSTQKSQDDAIAGQASWWADNIDDVKVKKIEVLSTPYGCIMGKENQEQLHCIDKCIKDKVEILKRELSYQEEQLCVNECELNFRGPSCIDECKPNQYCSVTFNQYNPAAHGEEGKVERFFYCSCVDYSIDWEADAIIDEVSIDEEVELDPSFYEDMK